MIKSTLAALCTILSVASSAHAYSFAPSKEEATKGAPELRDDVMFQEKSINRFGRIFSKEDKLVVLTFDDGPRRESTTAVLNELNRSQIKATFFIQGSNVPGNTDLLAEMKRAGHLVGNHTFSHPNLTQRCSEKLRRLDPAKCKKTEGSPAKTLAQVARTNELIKPYQNENFKYFRAPFGNWGATHAWLLNNDPELNSYIGPIYWTIGGDLSCNGACSESTISSAADWACWSKGISVKACAAGYIRETERKGGGVMLLHDVHGKTAEMLPIIIDQLKRRGYKFINLNDVPDLEQYRDEVILK